METVIQNNLYWCHKGSNVPYVRSLVVDEANGLR